MIGEQHGPFYVSALVKQGSIGTHKKYRVICPHGNEYIKASNDIKRQKSCGCVNPDGMHILYSYLKSRHNKHSVEPLISYEYFRELSLSNCHYCNNAPSNYSEQTTYQGIDRIDSALGYTELNVRPCCRICNMMKSDLTEVHFRKHLEQIVSHWQLPFKEYPDGR